MIDNSPYRYGKDVRQLTIGGVLTTSADCQGEKPFINYLPDGRVLTYRDMDLESNRLANGLSAAGIRKGDHVAVLMENCPEILLSFFALAKLGAVAVPLNAAAKGPLLEYYIAGSDSVAILVEDGLVERLAEVLPNLSAVRLIVSTGRVEGRLPGGHRSLAMEVLLQSSDTRPTAEVHFTDLAIICYTSGTTGPSKGVMFTHARALLWGMSHVGAYGQHGSDIFYVCLPLFHVNGLLGSTYNAMSLGATVALQRRFSASGFWNDIRESGATVGSMMGSMAAILWSRPPAPDDRHNALRMSAVGPMPSMASEFEERFGMKFVMSFGSTDLGAVATYSTHMPPEKLGSCGLPRPGIEVRIVDEDDFDVPAGTLGQIVARNNNLWETSLGYYKMPEVTLTTLRNNWFHTGDLGYFDADGYLWFVGRDKEVIRRRGENISAVEVEKILLSHPAIVDAAVYPVAAALGEDDVAASLILKQPGSLSEEDLVRFCADRMAYYMVPKYIEFVADLPRNASQKVEKYKLRAVAEAQKMVGLWDRDLAGVVISR